MPKQPPYEPVQRVDDLAVRAERARCYMAKMSDMANRGFLGSETLVGLQRPSQGLPEGVPAMVLVRDGSWRWVAAERTADGITHLPEPDVTVTERNATVTPDRNAEPEIVTAVTPTVTERNAPETMTNAERQKRHRDRKKAERAQEAG